MFLTVHAAAGIIVGIKTGNPILAFIAGVISHFILDMIPHGDQDLVEGNDHFSPRERKLLRYVGVADTIIMLAELGILYWLGLAPLTWSVSAAVVGALLPDFLNAVYVFTETKILLPYFHFQRALHYVWNRFTINMTHGMIVQTVFLVGLLTILVQYK